MNPITLVSTLGYTERFHGLKQQKSIGKIKTFKSSAIGFNGILLDFINLTAKSIEALAK